MPWRRRGGPQGASNRRRDARPSVNIGRGLPSASQNLPPSRGPVRPEGLSTGCPFGGRDAMSPRCPSGVYLLAFDSPRAPHEVLEVPGLRGFPDFSPTFVSTRSLRLSSDDPS